MTIEGRSWKTIYAINDKNTLANKSVCSRKKNIEVNRSRSNNIWIIKNGMPGGCYRNTEDNSRAKI